MSYHNNKVFLQFVTLYVFHNGFCLHQSTPMSYDTWNNYSILDKVKFIKSQWPDIIYVSGYTIEVVEHNAAMTNENSLLYMRI